MNGLSRHEAFQRILAGGARRAGAVVLSAATTECCDLVVLPPLGTDLHTLCLEVKTRGDGTYAKLPPAQERLVGLARAGGHPFVQVTAILHIQGWRKGTREPYGKIQVTVNGEKEGPMAEKYRAFLTRCLDLGYKDQAFQASAQPSLPLEHPGGAPGRAPVAQDSPPRVPRP